MKKKRKASGSAGGGEKRLKVEEQPSISSNVELMRSLRLSSTPVSSKMDQAFQFVERQNGGFHSTGVPMPQFVSFLAGWIQWEMMKLDEGGNLAMDARSWKIFHWCVSSQRNLHIYPGMLKAIDLVLRTKIMAIKGSKITTINQATRFSVEEKAAVIEVLELLLRCYDRTFRPQLLDWTVFASSFFGELLESDLDDDAMKIGVSIADGFGKFISTQANLKAAFQAMIDKVLAPLLKLQGALIVEKKDGELVELLLGAIGRVLDCGVFHTAAVEGFPIVCTAAARWLDEQVLEREANTRIQKMLFEKIKQLRDERCSSALASLGELLKIFAQRFKSFRASIKSDLFGVLGQREESEIPEIKQDESGEESKSVRLSDNQQQFLVFIELALPLIQQLSDEKEISGKNMLIAAINNLFEVARDQGIYVPTRDTPTSGHFKFVKFYYGVLVDYAQSIRSIDDEVDIGLGYREIVRGMSLVLEIDHRAVDDGVESFWLTLLSATAIRSGDDFAVAEAIAAGCRMLKISGELRNVDAIPRLFSCVKPIERFQLGLQRFFCDASFQESLRKTIETMPEAQSAEIVNMVSRFASETLTTLNTAGIAAVAASGEIQGQILENLKVSSTNAYQVGVNVRTIVDSVVADPLRQLLVKVANGKRSDRLGLRSFYLIRLYLTCRMLHRQCISMMSPEKAAAAAAAAHEFHLDSLELDWIEVALEQQELSIFAWIGQSTPVLAVVNGLLQGSGKNSFPSLYYLTDLLAIQRLADLQRYIHSVEYFDAKLTTSSVEDPVLSSIDAEDQTGDSSRKSLQQLLSDFKIEAKQLVDLLLEGGSIYSIKEIEKFASTNKNKIRIWNGVVASLTGESIYPARWRLISRSIDLWSKYASRTDLTRFITCALVCCDPASESWEMLHNLQFCENQRVQDSLLPAAWSALRELLHVSWKFKQFKDPCFENFDDLLKIELFPESNLERCVDLLKLIAFFPWAQRNEIDTKQCIFTMCFIEGLALKMVDAVIQNKSSNPVVEIFEIFAVSRLTTHSFANTRSKQIGNNLSKFDIEVFSWMYRSIDTASGYAIQLKQSKDATSLTATAIDTSLASVIKSSQAYVQRILQQILTSGSSLLPSGPQIESAAETDSCIQQVLKLRDEHDTDLRSYSLLGSISLARSILTVVAESITVLDRSCQEQKNKELRWSTNIPWIPSLGNVEGEIVNTLLVRIAGIQVSGSSLLDVFFDPKTDSKPSETAIETPVDEQDEEQSSDDEDEADGNSIEIEDPKLDSAQDMEDAIDQAGEVSQLDRLPTAGLIEHCTDRQGSEIAGELFIAMAAMVKLRSLYFSPYALRSSPISKTTIPSSIGALLRLLYSILADAASILHQTDPDEDPNRNLYWIFGAVKCMESLGFLLPSLDPSISRADFVKLLRIHVDLLGALLWLDPIEKRSAGVSIIDDSSFYSDLKTAVKDSFCALITFAPIPQLLLAFHTIQKGLAGSSDISRLGSTLRLGDCDDGRVGVVIAASVDCLAAVLDAVSGPRRLKVLARYSPRFVAGLVNLFTYLQGAAVNKHLGREARPATIDSSSVLLQSLEIITRIGSREVIFPIRSVHVALALHAPVGILKPAYQFELARSIHELHNIDAEVVSRIYIASCKMLYTLLRHRKRESGRSIALLGESLRVLLHCLQCSSKFSTVMTTETAVQCARWLRRIYEELGEQKETLGRYCMNILSDYLCVLSGRGPFEAGLDRDVDKELRLGVYALLSSPQDLQQLHASLGEGPMRTNLAIVRNDYEKKFKYTGKI